MISGIESRFKNPFIFGADFAADVYDQAQSDLDKSFPTQTILPRVSPDTKYCMYVNGAATRLLQDRGVDASYIESGQNVVSHAFVNGRLGSFYLLDWQFKQFVSKEERLLLPPLMAIKYHKLEDVIKGLEEHRIPRVLHYLWLEEIDWVLQNPK